MADTVRVKWPQEAPGQDVSTLARSRWQSPAARETLLAFLALGAVAAATLGPYVLDGGFYLDDWGDAAGRFYPPGGASFENVLSYFYDIFHYRPVLVLYTPLKYFLFGTSIPLHLAWTALLAVLIATMLYGILRTLGVPWYHAWVIAALSIIYPWFDSVRLWESANPPPVSICIALLGLWIALIGAKRRSWRLHACSAVLYLLSILTYEITLPLIAAFGVLYVLIAGWRVAKVRWAVDLAVVILGGIWMGTHTTRSVSGVSNDLTHLEEIVSGAAMLAGRTLIPVGPQPRTVLALLAAGAVIAVGVVIYVCRWRRSKVVAGSNWDLPQWLLMLAAGLLVAVLGWLIFIPADPYYTPTVYGITNRVNALAGYGLVIAAYAVLGTGGCLLGELFARFRSRLPVVTVALAVLLGAAYIHVLDRHVGIWQKAYQTQLVAIDRMKKQYPTLPPGTMLFTSNYAAYQTLGVAIFAATWDVDGMMKLEYGDGTVSGYPVIGMMELACRSDGIGLRGAGAPPVVAPYGKARLLNLATGEHSAPSNRSRCRKVVGRYVAGPMYLESAY